MRVAIDTQPLRPPLTGIGHFVHRLTNAMLPLLASNEELLSFNGWGIESLDQEFLARAETRNSSLDSEQSMWTLRHVASKGRVVLRQMPPSSAKAFARCGQRVSIAQRRISISFTPRTLSRRERFTSRYCRSSTICRTCGSRNAPEGPRRVGGNTAQAACRSAVRADDFRILEKRNRCPPRHAGRSNLRHLPGARRGLSAGAGQRTDACLAKHNLAPRNISCLWERVNRARTSRLRGGLYGAAGCDSGAAPAHLGWSIRAGATLAFACCGAGERIGSDFDWSAMFRTAIWQRCIGTRLCSSCLRCMKDLACPWSKRWPAARASP